MQKNYEKKDLMNLSFDELSELYKYVVTVYKLESTLSEGKNLGIELFPESVFGQEQINDISLFIKDFKLTEKNKDSVMGEIYSSELEILNINELYNENTNQVSGAVDLLARTDFFTEMLENDEAQHFLQLFEDAILSLTFEVSSLTKIRPYERNNYFMSMSRDKIKMLSYYIVMQSKIGRLNDIREESSISEKENLTIVEKIKKRKVELKKEYKSTKGFFSRILSTKEKKTKSEDDELSSVLEIIELLLQSVFNSLYLIIQSNRSLTRDVKSIKYLKNSKSATRIFDYVNKFSTYQVERIRIELEQESLKETKEKEEYFFKTIFASNIIHYSQNITIDDPKDLSKYF